MTTNHRPALEGKRGKANTIGNSISHARALPQQNTLKYRREAAVDHATASSALQDLQRSLSAREEERDIKRRRIAEFEDLDASADSDDEETRKLLLEIELLKEAAKSQFGKTLSSSIIDHAEKPQDKVNSFDRSSDTDDNVEAYAAGLTISGDGTKTENDAITSIGVAESSINFETAKTNTDEALSQEPEKSQEPDNDDESDYDSEDSESETKALLEELQKIKQEREATKKEFELGSDASKYDQRNSSTKNDWRSDSIFSNRRQHTAPVSSESFTNDTLKSGFHKDFLKKYVR